MEVHNFEGLSTPLWIDYMQVRNVEESGVEVHGADSTLEKEVPWCGNSSIESKEISLH